MMASPTNAFYNLPSSRKDCLLVFKQSYILNKIGFGVSMHLNTSELVNISVDLHLQCLSLIVKTCTLMLKCYNKRPIQLVGPINLGCCCMKQI